MGAPENKKLLRICYMGIVNPDFSRTRVYLAALKKLNVNAIECFVPPQGLRKFQLLFKKHWLIRNDYDVLVVAYPGHMIVWFARLISRKPVVFDALCTLWEAEVLSHEAGFLKEVRVRCIDWLAVHSSTVVLVESQAQKNFFIKRFGGNPDKYQVVYTGADESLFFIDQTPKLQKFTAVFRGRLSHESGIEYVVQAAKILENENINFRIVGFGYLLATVQKLIEDLKITNIEVVSEQLSFPDLKRKMAECQVSLGQFGNNERLERTIPHKAFESLALGIPYVTARAEAVSEILEDGESAIMVQAADPDAIARAVLSLRDNPAYADSIKNKAHEVFTKRLSQQALGEELVSIFSKVGTHL